MGDITLLKGFQIMNYLLSYNALSASLMPPLYDSNFSFKAVYYCNLVIVKNHAYMLNLRAVDIF